MGWPNETYPKTTGYAVIELFRKVKITWVILILLTIYICINVFFGFFYYMIQPFKCVENLCTSIYFSFITGLTIGFGDYVPITSIGKFIVILQGIFSTFFYSIIISFISLKIIFPFHTINFSNKIVTNGTYFKFRIINSHRALLVNPEIRISIVEHNVGNVLATTVNVPKIDTLVWLDNHDFVIGFASQVNPQFSIFNEWGKACVNEEIKNQSRFKIRISISGSYGMQQYVQVKNYFADDVVIGNEFKAIQYSKEDKKIYRNIRFNRFGDFWNDFNSIEK